jgi:hypothetical protein
MKPQPRLRGTCAVNTDIASHSGLGHALHIKEVNAIDGRASSLSDHLARRIRPPDRDYLAPKVLDEVADKVAADEAGAACEEYLIGERGGEWGRGVEYVRSATALLLSDRPTLLSILRDV